MDMILDFLQDITNTHYNSMINWIEQHISDIIKSEYDLIDQLRDACENTISVWLYDNAFLLLLLLFYFFK